MDIVVPFDDPAQVRFNDAHVLESVLSVASLSERVAIVKFKKKKANESVVVRFITSDSAHQRELEMERQVERMRKALGLQDTIIALHGYFVCADPFATYPALQKYRVNAFEGAYLGVIMEHVPLKHTDLDTELMDEWSIVSILVDLLYTLWLARRDFQFYHGDLHLGNIMFRPDTRGGVREYVVGGHRITATSEYIPVMIDFEKSIFGVDATKRERFSDVRLVVGAMRDLFTYFGHTEPSEFRALFNLTRDDTFDRNDDRFHPQTIVDILTKQDLFETMREELEGDEEPQTKRLVKGCLQCKQDLVAVQCSVCAAQFCSKRCANKAWSRAEGTCHL